MIKKKKLHEIIIKTIIRYNMSHNNKNLGGAGYWSSCRFVAHTRIIPSILARRHDNEDQLNMDWPPPLYNRIIELS